MKGQPTPALLQTPSRRFSLLALLRRQEAAQLVEFAFMLPLLVILVIGGVDFGQAYRLKQRLTNAAREGARIAIGQSQADLAQAIPSTVQAVRNAVVNYLSSENMNTSFIAATPTKTGPREWTYSSTASGQPVLVINRGAVVPVTVGGVTTLAVSTRVTLRYPHTWTLRQALMLFSSSTTVPASFQISTTVVMKNLN